VIIEVLIAKSQAEKALPHEFFHAVFNQFRVAVIGKTTRQNPTDPKSAVDLLQKQRSPVTADLTAGEIGPHFFASKVLKKHRRGETFCLTCGGVGIFHIVLITTILHIQIRLSTLSPVIFSG
jgi:hypothetical protein